MSDPETDENRLLSAKKGLLSEGSTTQHQGEDLAALKRRTKASRTIIASSWSGPFPPPNAIAEYKQIDPAFPDRMMTMSESAIRHDQLLEIRRQDLVEKVHQSDAAIARQGQLFAFVLTLVAFIMAGIVAVYGGPVAGSIVGTVLGGGVLIGLVTAFIKGRSRSAEKDASPVSSGLPEIESPDVSGQQKLFDGSQT